MLGLLPPDLSPRRFLQAWEPLPRSQPPLRGTGLVRPPLLLPLSVPPRPTGSLGGSSRLLGCQGSPPASGRSPSCVETLTLRLPTRPSWLLPSSQVFLFCLIISSWKNANLWWLLLCYKLFLKISVWIEYYRVWIQEIKVEIKVWWAFKYTVTLNSSLLYYMTYCVKSLSFCSCFWFYQPPVGTVKKMAYLGLITEIG